MKTHILLLCATTLAFSSCCKKTACLENHSIPITFYGFTAAEVDTIYTTGYAINSKFSSVSRTEEKDTAGHLPHLPDNTYSLVIREPHTNKTFNHDVSLYDKHEWKIYIPSVNRTILIHNYGYNTYRCNPCGLKRGEKTNSLSTCSVDDSTQRTDDIRIYK